MSQRVRSTFVVSVPSEIVQALVGLKDVRVMTTSGGPEVELEIQQVDTLRLAAHMYPIGYNGPMLARNVLERARQEAGLSQAALARRAATSRPTLSAYEHGRKSPTLDTATRIVAEAGFDLTITPKIEFREFAVERGRPIQVPSNLPRLPLDQAFAVVELPLHLNWSDRGRRYALGERRQRARVYEVVLREGGPDDVLAYLDGALLADLWEELVLPPAIRSAWACVIPGALDEHVA